MKYTELCRLGCAGSCWSCNFTTSRLSQSWAHPILPNVAVVSPEGDLVESLPQQSTVFTPVLVLLEQGQHRNSEASSDWQSLRFCVEPYRVLKAPHQVRTHDCAG